MITLNDQTLLRPLLKTLQIQLSEYSFANLFLFRKKHSYQIITIDNETYVQGVTYDGLTTLMPTTLPKLEKTQKLVEAGQTFFPIPEEWKHRFPQNSHFTNQQADNDYLFKRENIATYPGRALSGKRNLVNQFEREYRADMVQLGLDTKKDAIAVLDQWGNHAMNPNHDHEECKEALDNLEELSLTGSIYYVDGKPIAFILGEALTDDTYILHFVKGLTDYKGVYPYIYQQFARKLPEHFHWLNFEQDLGLPNLRQAKHSFAPDHYGLKFRVNHQ